MRRLTSSPPVTYYRTVGCVSSPPQVQANGLDERSLRDGRYDGILHLVTAACGAEEHYSLENNEVRSESVEVARDVSKVLVVCFFRVRLWCFASRPPRIVDYYLCK